jgi:hypothetical protein
LGELLQCFLVFSAHRLLREHRTPCFPREGPLTRQASNPWVISASFFCHAGYSIRHPLRLGGGADLSGS